MDEREEMVREIARLESEVKRMLDRIVTLRARLRGHVIGCMRLRPDDLPSVRTTVPFEICPEDAPADLQDTLPSGSVPSGRYSFVRRQEGQEGRRRRAS